MREATADTERTLRLAAGFLVLWALLFAAKAVLAARLPLFVDEAFYWQEGMHPGWAYSDLPALTAWLARLGVEIGGRNALGLRMPALLLAACVPWLVVAMARRIAGAEAGWRAGMLALLLPLSGTLGILALPDVAMTVAALLCLHAGVRLLQRVDSLAAAELALGLVMGGLSHYRFAAIVGVGAIALLASARGREVLRDPRVWVAIVVGALAWMPLLAWNIAHAEAGLRFQLVDRHPWVFHADGVRFVLLQALLATPLLFAALAAAAWRNRDGGRDGGRDAGGAVGDARRYLALSGGLFVLAFFALGFFADTERVSFHWPLQGMLALLPLVPGVLDAWGRHWRRATIALLACGLALALAGYAALASPAARARLAETPWYPSNFAGWDALADAVRAQLATMPPGTRLVADDFKIGAELGFLLGDPAIPVLDHPLNRKHGRAPQLRLWGLEAPASGARLQRPALLVIGATDVKFSELPERYRFACSVAGSLPAPSSVDVDHGAQRFQLFGLLPEGGDAESAKDACIPPALASISVPRAGAVVRMPFTVEGWAVKDLVGVARVTVTLDGKPVAVAEHGIANTWVPRFWQGRSRDPDLRHTAFSARVDAPGVAPGRHWLGLVLEGGDGSRETWHAQSVIVAP